MKILLLSLCVAEIWWLKAAGNFVRVLTLYWHGVGRDRAHFFNQYWANPSSHSHCQGDLAACQASSLKYETGSLCYSLPGGAGVAATATVDQATAKAVCIGDGGHLAYYESLGDMAGVQAAIALPKPSWTAAVQVRIAKSTLDTLKQPS